MAVLGRAEQHIEISLPAPVDVLEIRGLRVILDDRVPAAFGVLTKQLNQAYKRDFTGST